MFALESALLIRPYGSNSSARGLEQWNAMDSWKNVYGAPISETCFFGEDIIGGQFGVCDGVFLRLDPEIGEHEQMGSSIEEWARAVLDDFCYWTSYPTARDWQQAFGPLQRGVRLVPKQLLCLGGNLELDNLQEMDERRMMARYGFYAARLRGTAEGAEVYFSDEDIEALQRQLDQLG
ncbi:hypothetical protein KQI84_15840 [bacterium]|nr:hypothetical protein [bacterium]